MRTYISVVTLAAALIATAPVLAQLDLSGGGVSLDLGGDSGSASDGGASQDTGSSGSSSDAPSSDGSSSDSGSSDAAPSDSSGADSSPADSQTPADASSDAQSTAPADTSAAAPSAAAAAAPAPTTGPNGGTLIPLATSSAPASPAAPRVLGRSLLLAVTAPPIALPQVTIPPITIPQVAVPPVTTPPVVVPQAAVPQITIPQVTVPSILPSTPAIPVTLPVAATVVSTPSTPAAPAAPILSLGAEVRTDALVNSILNPVVNTVVNTVNSQAVNIVPVTDLVNNAGVEQIAAALQSNPAAHADLLNTIASSPVLTSLLNTQGIDPADVLAIHVDNAGNTELVVGNGAIDLNNLGAVTQSVLGPDGLGALTGTQLAQLDVGVLTESELVSADLTLLPNESQRVDAVVRLLNTGTISNAPPAPSGPARVFDVGTLLGTNALNVLGSALGPRPVIDQALQVRLDALGIDPDLVVAVRTEADGTLRIFTDSGIGTEGHDPLAGLSGDPLTGLTPLQLANLDVGVLTDNDLARVDVSLLPNEAQRIDAVLRLLAQNGPVGGTTNGPLQVLDLPALIGAQGLDDVRQALGLPQGAATIDDQLAAQLQSLGIDPATVLAVTTDLAGNARIFVDPTLSAVAAAPQAVANTVASLGNVVTNVLANPLDPLAGFTQTQLATLDVGILTDQQLAHIDLALLPNTQQRVQAVVRLLAQTPPAGQPSTGTPELLDLSSLLGAQGLNDLRQTLNLPDSPAALDSALTAQLQSLGVNVATVLATTTDAAGNLLVFLDPALTAVTTPPASGGSPAIPSVPSLVGSIVDPLVGLSQGQLATLDVSLLTDEQLAQADLTLLPNTQQRVQAVVRLLGRTPPAGQPTTGVPELVNLSSLLGAQGLDALRQALNLPQGGAPLDPALMAQLQSLGVDVATVLGTTSDAAGNLLVFLDPALTAVTTPPATGGGSGTPSVPNGLIGSILDPLAGLTQGQLAALDVGLLTDQQLAQIDLELLPNSQQRINAVLRILGQTAPAGQPSSGTIEVVDIPALLGAGGLDAVRQYLGLPQGGGPIDAAIAAQLQSLGVDISTVLAATTDSLGNLRIFLDPSIDVAITPPAAGSGGSGTPTTPTTPSTPSVPGLGGLVGNLLNPLVGLTQGQLATLDIGLLTDQQLLQVDLQVLPNAQQRIAAVLRLLGQVAPAGQPISGNVELLDLRALIGDVGLDAVRQYLGLPQGGTAPINPALLAQLQSLGIDVSRVLVATTDLAGNIRVFIDPLLSTAGGTPVDPLDPLAGLDPSQLASLDIGLLTDQELAHVNLQLLPNEQQRLGVILRLLQSGSRPQPGVPVPVTGPLQAIDLNSLLGTQALGLVTTLLRGTGDELLDLTLNPDIALQIGNAGLSLDTVAAVRVASDGQLQVFLDPGLTTTVASLPGTGGTGGNGGTGSTGGTGTGGTGTGGTGTGGSGGTGGTGTGGTGGNGGGVTIPLPGGSVTIGGNGSGGTGGTGGTGGSGGTGGTGSTGGGTTGGGGSGSGGTSGGVTVTIGGNGGGSGGTGSGGNGGTTTTTAGNPTVTPTTPRRPVIRYRVFNGTDDGEDGGDFNVLSADDGFDDGLPGARNRGAFGLSQGDISLFAELDCGPGVAAMMTGGAVMPATLVRASHLELVRVNGCQQQIRTDGVERLRGAIEGNEALLASLIEAGIPVDEIIGATMDGPIITLFVEQPIG